MDCRVSSLIKYILSLNVENKNWSTLRSTCDSVRDAEMLLSVPLFPPPDPGGVGGKGVFSVSD